jgi:primary-amine oxidase
MATPGFVRLGINIDGPWAQTDRQGDRITLDEQPPPESVQPGQQRFTIDDSEKYVSWSKQSSSIDISASDLTNLTKQWISHSSSHEQETLV